MKNTFRRNASARQAGFSLIEVLIGAVILATGLLALSALQGSLARNAADSRIRSQVAAAMESAAEADRGTANFPGIPATPPSVTIPGLGTLNIAIQSCNYRNLATGANQATCAGLGGTIKEPQFKRIVYGATWTDAGGATRSMTLTSIVSPRTIAGSSTLPFNTPTEGVKSAAPIVRTTNPEVAGMIPIAIGDNTDTAATNPKPTVYSGLVKKTSFEVLTYQGNQAGYGSNIVKQQRRVETAVIGCTCQNSTTGPTGAQFERPQWPAYWDGSRYTIYTPNPASGPYGETERAVQASGAVQDPLCTECCRDHHDAPSTTAVKFDPYRSGNHTHYSYDATNNAFVAATGASDQYMEVCRMIRVDGFWRTSQDMDAKYFALLPTPSDATSPVPSTAIQGTYETFVIDYLNARYVNAGSPDPAQMYADAQLNMPASIPISTAVTDKRYLHSRGLYVDNIEQVVANKIASARAAGGTSAQIRDRILPLLAFTSINMTELASWVSENINQLLVDSTGVNVFNPSSPNRGTVSPAATASAGTVAITTSSRKSNSGLIERPLRASGVEYGIDTEDDVAAQDQKPFVISGSPQSGNIVFTVRVTGWSGTTSFMKPSWASTASLGAFNECYAATPATTTSGNGSNATTYRMFTCTMGSSMLNLPVTIGMGRYNYQLNDVSASGVTVSCPVGDSRTYTFPTVNGNGNGNGNNSGATLNKCQNIRVSAVSATSATAAFTTVPGPQTGTDGLVGGTSGGWENTFLPYVSIANGAVITITLANESQSVPRASSCSPSPSVSTTVTSVIPGTCQ